MMRSLRARHLHTYLFEEVHIANAKNRCSRKTRTESQIENLPVETLADITRYLDPIQTVVFAMTCKKIWSRVDTRTYGGIQNIRRCLDHNDITELLRLLERDCPNHFICYVCHKLHKRLRASHSYMNPMNISKKTRSCAVLSGEMIVGRYYTTKGKGLRIHREMLELLLRSIELGPKYGMSPETLTRSFAWKIRGVKTNQVQSRSEAKAVYDTENESFRLMLKTVYSHEIDLRIPFKEQVDNAHVKTCDHHDLREPRVITTILSMLTTLHIDTSKKARTISRVHVCGRCPSDTVL